MSSWGIRLNPFRNSYSTLEADQMRFIHKAYCEAMGVGEEDLPIQLKMDENYYPTYKPTPADFDEHTFVRKMQDTTGLLRNPAEAIISSICAYQRERSERFSFGGYLNDPRTLLLEEFKDWAMRTLAPATCTTESILNDVRRRHGYVLRLQHGQQGLFSAGSGERSLMGTLKDVRSVIEVRVLPTIEAERAHSSARDQLQILEARGTDGLMHGVQFLFYVLRNTPNAPADCTISNLQSQQHSGMKDSLSTKSGEMLQVLLTTPSFKTLFPEPPTNVYGNNGQADVLRPLQLTSEEEQEMTTTAVFCDDNAKPIVPKVLTRTSSPASTFSRSKNGPSSEITITPTQFLSQSNSGIVPLREEAAIVAHDAFTQMHGLLKLLADLLVSCRKARQLAGPGGDLLVYGPGGEEVRRLMQSLEKVQGEILKMVSKLTRLGVRELDRLKPNQEKAWRMCFSKVLPLENYLAHDFGACAEPIQRMYANADPQYVQKMLKQFRQATGLWVQENSAICRHVSQALGIPYVETRKISNGSDQAFDMSNAIEGPQVEMLENGNEGALVVAKKNGAKQIAYDADADALNGSHSNSLVVAPPRSNGKRQSKFEIVEEDQPLDVAPMSNSRRPGALTKQRPPIPNDSFLTSASTFVTGVFGASRRDLIKPMEPQDDDDMPLALTNGSQNDDTKKNMEPPTGVLDVLLLVRQSIQRISQLSWGVRTSVHTAKVDEGDADAFVFLCSIYEAVGVQCSSDLLIRLRHHQLELKQILRRHLQAIISCMYVLQTRILQQENGIKGMYLVYRVLEQRITSFEHALDTLATYFKQMSVEASRMSNGIQQMPLLQQMTSMESSSASALTFAFQSINAVASRFGGENAPSSAILSHGEYMSQMTSEMDLHWNSLSHLTQSVQGTAEAVANVTAQLQHVARDKRNVVPPQQLDYIFEYNYDGFFRTSIKELEGIVKSFDNPQA